MIDLIMGPLKRFDWSNRRLGIILALLVILYIAAVIAFIIIY